MAKPIGSFETGTKPQPSPSRSSLPLRAKDLCLHRGEPTTSLWRASDLWPRMRQGLVQGSRKEPRRRQSLSEVSPFMTNRNEETLASLRRADSTTNNSLITFYSEKRIWGVGMNRKAFLLCSGKDPELFIPVTRKDFEKVPEMFGRRVVGSRKAVE